MSTQILLLWVLVIGTLVMSLYSIATSGQVPTQDPSPLPLLDLLRVLGL